MKIEQKTKFQPITITLETEEEAKALRNAVLQYEDRGAPQIHNDTLRAMSNWFNNVAQMLHA